MTTIDISGLDKAEVLHALVSEARPMGMGLLQDRPFSLDEAREWIERCKFHDNDTGALIRDRSRLYFDYVTGRPLKVDITDDTFDGTLYDRDQGEGAAERAIAKLRG